MASESSQPDQGPELQAAFRRHLPGRLDALVRRIRAQCRDGWRSDALLLEVRDELALLAGACAGYGEPELRTQLRALRGALADPAAAHGARDAATDDRIAGLLDALGSQPRSTPVTPSAPAPDATRADTVQSMEVGGSGDAPPSWDSRDAGVVDAAPKPDRAARVAGTPAGAGLDSRGARVSIINDDDPAVTELMLRLDQQGCEVALVEHVGELAGQLRRAPPRLAVLVVGPDTSLDELAAPLAHARRDPQRRVRLLALLRGQQVELQLRALRAGADRCVALPASAAEVLAAANELLGGAGDPACRILIVEDDPAQALFAEAILRHAGMEVRVLGESLPVLDELDRFQPDLLLLDLNMPDHDGLELTAMIRARGRHPDLPIVFLSGDQDRHRRAEALDAGGDDFLVKPIRPAHLVSAVTDRVRRARSIATGRRREDPPAADTVARGDARFMTALARHLASPAAAGGLLSLEVHDAVALRTRLGPAAFERALADVGAFIAARVPVGCLTARQGDAGCLVFAPDRDESGLATLARDLMGAAREARFGARASALGFVGGACGFDATTATPDAALAALERTVVLARGERGRVVCHSQLAPDRAALAQQLIAALAEGALRLAFQPIVAVGGGGLPHWQAMPRLQTPAREYVAGELAAMATRVGSIGVIDGWVTRRCVALLARRLRKGQPLALTASQSLAAWRDASRATELEAELEAAGVPGDRLTLEFPVRELRAHAEILPRLAAWMRRVGVKLSLAGVDGDVVAAGWLARLPVATVKLSPDAGAEAIAAVVVAAHAHGIGVVAPQVATGASAERLRAAGVDFLQGEYLRPARMELDAALPGVPG